MGLGVGDGVGDGVGAGVGENVGTCVGPTDGVSVLNKVLQMQQQACHGSTSEPMQTS